MDFMPVLKTDAMLMAAAGYLMKAGMQEPATGMQTEKKPAVLFSTQNLILMHRQD